MKVTIEATDAIVELETREDGARMPARVWEGTTESGTKVQVFVTRISPQTHDPDKLAQFETELRATRKPEIWPSRRDVIDWRMII